MRLRTLLTITGVLQLTHALLLFPAPAPLLHLYGVPVDAATLALARFTEASFGAFGLLALLGRKHAATEAGRAFAAAGMVENVLLAVAAFLAARSGAMNSLAWPSGLVFLLFGLGYSYHFFVSLPGPSVAAGEGGATQPATPRAPA